MRLEASILIGVGIFFGLIGIIYWLWSAEDTGTMLLVGTATIGLLPGSYYFYWSRRMGRRPEDRDDGTIEHGAGTVGSFPGSSIWPFVLGIGAAFTVLAFVFGIWLIFFGGALVGTALVGVTVESRRGGTV